MTSPRSFERVYVRYDSVEEQQIALRVKVNQLSDGDYLYEVPGTWPGEWRHVCSSRECPDVDRIAMALLTA